MGVRQSNTCIPYSTYKMIIHVQGCLLVTVGEEDYEVYLLPKNLTMTQIKNHKERKMKKTKVRLCLFVGVSQMIFTKIMTLKTLKAIWDYLKEKYTRDDRIQSMQLNLRREFEL